MSLYSEIEETLRGAWSYFFFFFFNRQVDNQHVIKLKTIQLEGVLYK